jgi:hypothetical protein
VRWTIRATLVVAMALCIAPPLTAEEAATVAAPQRALKAALADFEALRALPDFKALADKNADVRARLAGLQRALNSVHREISGQMREAAKGNARDTAFHAVSLTRELGKLESLNKVAPDIKALADSSPAYKTQYAQWEQSLKEGQSEVDRNVGRYLIKVSRFKAYPTDLREAAFKDLQQENGQSELGRRVVDQIHAHVMATGILTRDGVLSDFRKVVETP